MTDKPTKEDVELLFNVNHCVSVRLTEIGHREHKRPHEELYMHLSKKPKYKPPEEVDGWSTWQMHVLMSFFGHMLTPGFKLPFEPEIKIHIKG